MLEGFSARVGDATFVSTRSCISLGNAVCVKESEWYVFVLRE